MGGTAILGSVLTAFSSAGSSSFSWSWGGLTPTCWVFSFEPHTGDPAQLSPQRSIPRLASPFSQRAGFTAQRPGHCPLPLASSQHTFPCPSPPEAPSLGPGVLVPGIPCSETSPLAAKPTPVPHALGLCSAPASPLLPLPASHPLVVLSCRPLPRCLVAETEVGELCWQKVGGRE